MVGVDLVFEIGTEELPSSAIYSAVEQLNLAVPTVLKGARIEYDALSVLASPRRIAVLISGLAQRQSDSVERFKGPASKVAFDADGKPTQAAIGFARGKGVSVEELELVEDAAGSYVYATVEKHGRSTGEVLPALLQSLVEGIDWAKSMRWGTGDTRFARPVRWLMCLLGDDVVPVEFAGLVAERTTRGHRFLAPAPLNVSAAGEYLDVLRSAYVLADQAGRGLAIREGIDAAAASCGDRAVVPEGTLAEVINLVEWPTVVVGTFDEAFLAVPREMLEHAMTSHQRYFPLERADGTLDNRFLVAHNGDPARSSEIVRGHERVIRARLSDAAFFYREDLSEPLEGWFSRLEGVVFQEKLGTLADKALRIERLASSLADMLEVPADTAAYAARAAHLAKADLVTNAVVEFTDLQGVMGRYYALASGEAPEVAEAIEEHYRPRFADDALPVSVAGRLVSVADKTDTICGIFAAGLAPKGSSDPFALRRAAIGILQMGLNGTEVPLDDLISQGLAGYVDAGLEIDTEAAGTAIRTFIVGRLEGILRDRGFAYDTVDAVLAVAADSPADALERCTALTAAREQAAETFEDLSIAFKRASNLVGDAQDITDRALMGEHEAQLDDALVASADRVAELLAKRDYVGLLAEYAEMRAPIDAFFENVLVMDQDAAKRSNRLGLLARFVALFERFADFSKMAG